jgi:hypothetical protein
MVSANFLFYYVSSAGIVLFILSKIIFFKGVRLYKKRKNRFALLVAMAFLVLTISYVIQIFDPENKNPRYKKTFEILKTYGKQTEGIVAQDKEITQKYHLFNIHECNFQSIFTILSLLIILFAFYYKVRYLERRKKNKRKTNITKNVTIYATIYTIIITVLYVLHIFYPKKAFLPILSPIFTTSFFISITFIILIFIVGITTYRLTKNISYLYLAIAFMIISDLLGTFLTTLILILPAIIYTVSHHYVTVILEQIFIIVAYTLSFIAITEEEKMETKR